ncbi:MAG: hypothetical protein KO202_04070 [Methanobacteriaceae archaeon]|nr:hypothetical protein [Methanobacteriaceae archaeon]
MSKKSIILALLVIVIAIFGIGILFSNNFNLSNNSSNSGNNSSAIENNSSVISNKNDAKDTSHKDSSSNTPPGKRTWNNQNESWMYEETNDNGDVRQYDENGNLIGSTHQEDQKYLNKHYSVE